VISEILVNNTNHFLGIEYPCEISLLDVWVSSWKETGISEGLLDVDDISDAIWISTFTDKLIPSPIDLVGRNDLAVWIDIVFGTEVDALLSLLDSTNERTTDTPSIDHETKVADLMWLNDTSKLNKGTLFLEKRHVKIKIMLSWYGVQNDVACVSISLDWFWVLRDNKDFGSLFLGHSLLFGAGRNGNDFVSHSLGKFNTHGTKTTNTNDTDSFATSKAVPVI